MAVEISASIGALYPGTAPGAGCSAAAADGFRAVEFWAIPAEDVEAVVGSVRAHELTVASINAGTGEAPDSFGLLGIPDAVDEWRRAFASGLDIARRLHARAMNLLVGGRLPAATRKQQLDCIRRNLDWCLPQLGGDDPVLLIEPLNAADRRSPVVRTVDDALAVLHSVGAPPQLGVLFDAYHLHQEEPDLHAAFDRARPFVRHVQVADHPGRGEPGSGAIPLAPFIEHVVASGYDGGLGCEFLPTSPAVVPTTRAALAALVSRHATAAS